MFAVAGLTRACARARVGTISEESQHLLTA
jgi:hypothetical protein